MNKELDPVIETAIRQLDNDQNKIDALKGNSQKFAEIPISLTPTELVALGWHFFQPTLNGSILDGDRVTPRSIDWGKCQAHAIQAAVIGTTTLQHKILQLIVAQNKAAKHATE